MPYPPLLLIHGAANGAWVWEFWRRELKALGWDANVLDLRGHGVSMPIDMTTVTMDDYVADVESVTRQMEARLGQHPLLFGWSLGGLVALMYAEKHPATAGLVLLSPSPPLQVACRASAEEVRATPSGPFGPELYGIYPDDPERSKRPMPDLTGAERAIVLEKSRDAVESGFARRQRRRGISLDPANIRCPALVVYGEEDRQFAPEVNRRTAILFGAETISVPAVGHWGVVFSEAAIVATAPQVDSWLRRNLTP